MDFDFTTETITADSTKILTIGGTAGLELAIGTTVERPLVPQDGTIRYNSNLNTIEGFSNGTWSSLIGVTDVIGTLNQVDTFVSPVGAVTLSTPLSFIAPGSLQYASLFGHSYESLPAAGTSQGTATLISRTITSITSGGINAGIILPVPSFVGELHRIQNNTPTIKQLYPHVGGNIDNESVDSAVFISPNLSIMVTWTGAIWDTVQNSITADAGINVSYTQGNVVIGNTGVLSFSGGSTGLLPSTPATGAVVLSGTLGIGSGGTGNTSALSAFNALSPLTTAGDILYRDSANNVRLPIGADTSLLSVSSGSPSWVTQSSINAGTAVISTNVAGGSAGDILYQTGPNTSVWLSAGTTSQVLVSGTSPSWVSVPTALGYTPVNKAGDTITGTLDMGSNYISNIADPVNPQDAATKAYVDANATGLKIKDSVRVATVTALTATYVDGSVDANGGLGIGATLTNSGTQSAIIIDGVALIVSDRVLIKNQVNQVHNGIYVVTDIGSGSSNWVLTRSVDYNDSIVDQVGPGDYVFVISGTTNLNSGWVQTEPATIIIGTDNIVFSQFSSSTSYTAGTGLQLSGTQFSNTGVLSNIAGVGIGVSGATGNVTITNSGVTSLTAGTGIGISGSTGNVTVSTMSSTINVVSNYTITSTILTVFADGQAGGFTVTLPATAPDGAIHNIKKVDETRTRIIINGNGNLIDKYSTIVLDVPFINIQVQWNNTSARWQII